MGLPLRSMLGITIHSMPKIGRLTVKPKDKSCPILALVPIIKIMQKGISKRSSKWLELFCSTLPFIGQLKRLPHYGHLLLTKLFASGTDSLDRIATLHH